MNIDADTLNKILANRNPRYETGWIPEMALSQKCKIGAVFSGGTVDLSFV